MGTPFDIVVFSCSDDLGNVRPKRLLARKPRKPVAVIANGDLHYSNMGTGRYVRGKMWYPDVLWRDGVPNPPENARSVARLLERFEVWNGDQGLPVWREFWAEARAQGIPVYWMLDDHDMNGDNEDHSLACLSGTFPDSYVGVNDGSGKAPYGQVLTAAQMTLADKLSVWRMRQAAKKVLLAKYMANPPSPGFNGDIPAGMVGVAQASDFDIDYFALDFGVNGEAGGQCFRVLCPDGVSYKGRMADPDDATKNFYGPVQTAWFRAQLLDAKAKGMFTLWVSNKDLYGTDNNDGIGAAYTYWRDQQLAFIEANDIKVSVASGDKHLLHTSIAYKSQGAITDLVEHGACPFGSRHSPLNQHKELVWSAPSAHRAGYLRVTVDPDARTVRMATCDGYDDEPLSVDVLSFDSRRPIQSIRRPISRPVARGGWERAAITVPASGSSWQNTTGGPVTVLVVGGTVTNVAISRDGVQYDSLGVTRQVVLCNGEFIRPTYSSVPTMFYLPLVV